MIGGSYAKVVEKGISIYGATNELSSNIESLEHTKIIREVLVGLLEVDSQRKSGWLGTTRQT